MKRKRSVLVFGLDGATFRIVKPMIEEGVLPYMGSLYKHGYSNTLMSTLPPLTGSSWATFQTGVDPGKHGVFDFKNRKGELIGGESIKYPRIWEVLNKRGYSSCVINMPVTYPPKPLNGYLVSSFLTPEGGVYAYPPSLHKRLKKSSYKIDVDSSFLPEDEEVSTGVYREINSLVSSRLKHVGKLMHERPWDFFFTLFKATDLVQHYDYGGKRTRAVYKRIDKGIEKQVDAFKAKYPEREVHVVILSDHGFHPSAKYDACFYPILRDLGIIPNLPSPLLSLARYVRGKVWKFGLRQNIGPYGMYESDKKKRKKIVSELRRYKIKGERVFSKVTLASSLYGEGYSSEIPDILWITKEKFAPNADPLSKEVMYEKKTSLKGHHYSDMKGLIMIDSPLLLKRQDKSYTPSIDNIASLVYDVLEVPSQGVSKHGFRLKRSKSVMSRKVSKAKGVIRDVAKKYKNPAIAWTGGKDSTVLLHLIKSTTKKKIPVIFIDHGDHFEETYEFVEKLEDEWGLKVIRIKDDDEIEKYKSEKSYRKRKRMARMIKVKGISYAVKNHGFDCLFVGIRKDEHEARSHEKYVSPRDDHDRIHPILGFKEENVWQYIHEKGIPYNPLYDVGYRSIGEKSFTSPVFDSTLGERGGREKEKEKIMESLRKLGYF